MSKIKLEKINIEIPKTWQLVCKTDYPNVVSKVHPLKQKKIDNLLNSGVLGKVENIILFGSSLTWDCNITSDVDLAIKYKNDSTLEDKYHIWEDIVNSVGDVDIVDLSKLDSDEPIFKSICDGIKLRRL